MYYLFPFEKIKHGAKVVIYGAGNVGQWFLSQLQTTGFAKVVAIADRAYSLYPRDMGAKLVAPESIAELDYDAIVIAIENPDLVNDIREFLIQTCNVRKEEIICGCGQRISEPMVIRALPPGYENIKISPFAFREKGISLAAFLPGGLGDDIISKRFLEALRELADWRLCIDIYCSKQNRNYAEAIFQEHWYQIFDVPELYECNMQNYDIALKADYILAIDHVASARLCKISPKLADMMVELQIRADKYALNAKPTCEYSIHFARSRYLGWNAYVAMGHGLLNYENNHVHIPLQALGKKRFQELGLSPHYITLNYGWGTRNYLKRLPAKIWPFGYYEELVRLLHSEFPQLSLVQLGTPGCKAIDGVDFFLEKENLETIKYVLQSSRLHIDCEGGLVHLATQLGTKCAVLFGPTPISYFGYNDNINICAGSCSNCYYVYDDFTLCARGLDESECMLSLTPDYVMEQISSFLKLDKSN